MKYDFKCEKCENIFEKKMTANEYVKEKENIKCPKCESKAKRVYSFGNFAIKTGDGIK